MSDSTTAYAGPFPPPTCVYMVSTPDEAILGPIWFLPPAPPLTEERMRQILREELERLAPKRKRRRRR